MSEYFDMLYKIINYNVVKCKNLYQNVCFILEMLIWEFFFLTIA